MIFRQLLPPSDCVSFCIFVVVMNINYAIIEFIQIGYICFGINLIFCFSFFCHLDPAQNNFVKLTHNIHILNQINSNLTKLVTELLISLPTSTELIAFMLNELVNIFYEICTYLAQILKIFCKESK